MLIVSVRQEVIRTAGCACSWHFNGATTPETENTTVYLFIYYILVSISRGKFHLYQLSR